MNIWFAVPSARIDGGSVKAWKDAGYKVALFRDLGAPSVPCADIEVFDRYRGYAQAVNLLCHHILVADSTVQWIVTGGDDILPDPNHGPEQIAAECTEHFNGTFGVMQATGDRWGESPASIKEYGTGRGAYIDRVAGSPWMGREWCFKAHHGVGPLHPDFYHMFVDEALQEASTKFGVFWQRPDLIHKHQHWGLTGDVMKMPDFLKKVNTRQHWDESKAILDRIKADNFRECERIS